MSLTSLTSFLSVSWLTVSVQGHVLPLLVYSAELLCVSGAHWTKSVLLLTSRGKSLAIGQFVVLLLVRISAARIRQSLPVNSLDITASLHFT